MLERLGLITGSILIALLGLELACRLVRGPEALVHWSYIVLQERRATIGQGAGRLVHDARLGFVARPGYAKDGVSYDQHGYRRIPAPAQSLIWPSMGALPITKQAASLG